jgi:hypothetical protein
LLRNIISILHCKSHRRHAKAHTDAPLTSKSTPTVASASAAGTLLKSRQGLPLPLPSTNNRGSTASPNAAAAAVGEPSLGLPSKLLPLLLLLLLSAWRSSL